MLRKISMAGSTTLEKTTCYHCGDDCETLSISIDEKSFCCNGCKGVYQVLSENTPLSFDLNRNLSRKLQQKRSPLPVS